MLGQPSFSKGERASINYLLPKGVDGSLLAANRHSYRARGAKALPKFMIWKCGHPKVGVVVQKFHVCGLQPPPPPTLKKLPIASGEC